APKVELEREKKNAEGILKAIELGLVKAVHDVSKGGIAVALTEMALAGGVGFEVDISKVPVEGKLSPVEVLFSESQARFIVSFNKEDLEKLRELFDEFAVIGRVYGREMSFKGYVSMSLNEMEKIYRSLPKILGD
ncbi:MAG: phosphoribosylformylglycinamidine synthase, partial [Palaeococcus sp.]|uniref:AIR synthase-related protein n=1 Tax=Palaeococcus sp. (in: euryarchaeotes) TaxID=2820298 RepID=UPI0025EFAEA5